MAFTTLFVGGGLGFAAQCTSNAIQKIPISRRKWIPIGIGMMAMAALLIRLSF
jgi:hypothetical protein